MGNAIYFCKMYLADFLDQQVKRKSHYDNWLYLSEIRVGKFTAFQVYLGKDLFFWARVCGL